MVQSRGNHASTEKMHITLIACKLHVYVSREIKVSEIREAAIGFEAVKVSMSQDKNGITLRLSVHPNDCPPELHTDWVGSRYMVGMVRLNDFDEPEMREEQHYIERLIASAGLLCRNPDFWAFLSGKYPANVENEGDAVFVLRRECGIKSRSEFRDNADARYKFDEMKKEFLQWKKS